MLEKFRMIDAFFSSTPLSAAGRPIYYDEEVEIKIEESVSVLLQNNRQVVKELVPPGMIILTNVRLIVVANYHLKSTAKSSTAWAINLKSISKVEDCAKPFSTSTRISLHMAHTISGELGLKFSLGGKEEFMALMNKMILKRSWEALESVQDHQQKQQQQQPQQKFSVSNAGVGGIIRRQEKNMEALDSVSKTALSDLNSLMQQAKEVITLIRRFASHSSEARDEDQDEADSAMSETTTQVAEKNELESILQSIGMVSPVTRYSAGRLYHQQLARQLADLMLTKGRLSALGGMITLTDLYCVFNRARGTELISPEDLLKAAELTGQLNLGVSLKVFPSSGVKVLQLESCSDEQVVSQRIMDIFRNRRERGEQEGVLGQVGIYATDVSEELNLSLVIAKEQLFIAENLELICRDESVFGVRFYPNLFKTYIL